MSQSKYRQQDVRAPRGTTLNAKSWLTEAPLRMLMNNLDPDVAENPHERVVYGGIGRAARNWECYDAIVKALKNLESDETLLVQSGKPVGVFKTHENSPRVLIANSNLVPHWATWEHFNELDAKGLAMYGQMTAGSWIYIGSQGIVQGTYETFVEAGRQHYQGSLKGRWVLTAGLGGMGGAQPLAATLAGACSLNIECQQSRIDFRLRTRYVDEQATSLDDALARIKKYTAEGRAISIALCGNAAEIVPEMVKRGVRPDMVTDQTSAHDPLNGYLPKGWSWEEYRQRAQTEPAKVVAAAKQSMADHVKAMLAFQQMGVPTFDYGNNIRQMAQEMGVGNAFAFPGFVPAYIRPLFCRGIGPFRWAALSGDPEEIDLHLAGSWAQSFEAADARSRHAVLRTIEELLTNARRHGTGGVVRLDCEVEASDGPGDDGAALVVRCVNDCPPSPRPTARRRSSRPSPSTVATPALS